MEPADAIAPFAGAAGSLACQIVDADAGMAVEDAERRRLGLEALNHPGEHDVLQDVGMISGVKGVAVVHAAILRDL
jgi:hypothetical protein